MNNSLGSNYTVPFDVLYPLAPINGIGSQNELTPAALNQRFSSIRNNEHAILRAMGGLAQSLGGVQFLSEYAKGLSDIVYADSWSYTDLQIRGKTFTADYDPAGNPLVFTKAQVKFTSTGIGSVEPTQAHTLVFAGGLLLSPADYTLNYIYGSVILYVLADHVKADVPVHIVVFRKFNVWNKTITSHPTVTPSASFNGTTTFFEHILAKSAFGILYSTKHIAVVLNNKRLVLDVDYSINELPNDRISFRFLIAVGTSSNIKFHNTSEFASGTLAANKLTINKTTKTITFTVPFLADNATAVAPSKATDLRLFIRRTGKPGYYIDPKFVQITASNTIVISTLTMPSWYTALESATDNEIFWMRTIEPSKYSAAVSFPNGTFSATKNTYSFGVEGGGKLIFLNMFTLVFHNGKLIAANSPDIDFLPDGDKIIINGLKAGFPEASNYDGLSVVQNFNIPDGFEAGIAEVITDARSAWSTANTNVPALTDVYSGLNMNNTIISNLKAGIAPNHAVNLSQVQTMISTSDNNNLALIIALG